MSSRGEVRHSFSFDADNSEVLGLSRKKWRGPFCLEIWKSSIPFGEEITGSYHLLSLSDCFLSPFPWLLLPQNCPLILQNGRLCPLLWDVKMPGAHGIDGSAGCCGNRLHTCVWRWSTVTDLEGGPGTGQNPVRLLASLIWGWLSHQLPRGEARNTHSWSDLVFKKWSNEFTCFNSSIGWTGYPGIDPIALPGSIWMKQFSATYKHSWIQTSGMESFLKLLSHGKYNPSDGVSTGEVLGSSLVATLSNSLNGIQLLS